MYSSSGQRNFDTLASPLTGLKPLLRYWVGWRLIQTQHVNFNTLSQSVDKSSIRKLIPQSFQTPVSDQVERHLSALFVHTRISRRKYAKCRFPFKAPSFISLDLNHSTLNLNHVTKLRAAQKKFRSFTLKPSSIGPEPKSGRGENEAAGVTHD